MCRSCIEQASTKATESTTELLLLVFNKHEWNGQYSLGHMNELFVCRSVLRFSIEKNLISDCVVSAVVCFFLLFLLPFVFTTLLMFEYEGNEIYRSHTNMCMNVSACVCISHTQLNDGCQLDTKNQRFVWKSFVCMYFIWSLVHLTRLGQCFFAPLCWPNVDDSAKLSFIISKQLVNAMHRFLSLDMHHIFESHIKRSSQVENQVFC